MQRLTESQQALAEEAVGRAKRIAKRYARLFPGDADEFESSASWAAVRAALRFEPNRDGAVWKRWSGLRIKGEVRKCLSRRLHSRENADLDPAYLESSTGRETGNSDGADTLQWAIKVLPKECRAIVSLVYTENMTPSEAGEAIGLSGRTGRRIHKDAIQRLRELVAG